MSDEVKALAAFTVVLNVDGSISTKPVEPSDTVERPATTFDIYQASKELVSEIENQLLAERIAKLVVANIQPVDQAAEIKSKIIDALSDRGLTPPVN